MIMMLYTMVDKIDILLCIKERPLLCLTLTPAEFVQCEKELAEKKKNGHVIDSSKPAIEQSNTIKLKGGVLLDLKYVLADFDNHDEPHYALTCKSTMCSIDPTPSSMPLVGTNLLQENEDEFPVGRPPW